MLRRARIDVRVGQNEKRVLWHKLARIAPLAAATAVSGRTVGELRDDPEWRPKLELGDRRGVRGRGGGRRLAARRRPSGRSSTRWPTRRRPSAARDVAAGRRSELDAILGGVLRAAERLDVPCPTLTELAVAAGLR